MAKDANSFMSIRSNNLDQTIDFGVPQKQQNQSSNPFGFGVQSKPSTDFDNKQQLFKPFENKWSCFSPISNAGAPLKQLEHHSQASNHKCTDPDSCKCQIIEDFEHEIPLWKLTCYGHSKNARAPSKHRVSNHNVRAPSKHRASNHKCTDPDSCKCQIVEDFGHEKPRWKLTCYSHSKNGPGDIVVDVSYEELRAAAYDDGRHGLSLQSIVEREIY